MKSKRIKPESFPNRISFEVAVDRCTFVQAELSRLIAEKNLAELEAQKTHAAEIATLTKELNSTSALCKKYATAHRPELMPNEKRTKSVRTVHSTYGFRTGMPVLKLFARNSWEKVTDNLRALGKFSLTRTKYETDKQALLAAREGLDLSALGVKVDQDETFYIEPNTEGAETVQAGGVH